MARTLIEVYLHIVFSTKVPPTTNVISGTDDATAPRSVRYGRRFRGSRDGSLHSPARDPRLFHRPLRGRGHGIGLASHRSAVADAVTDSRAKPGRQELPISDVDVVKSRIYSLLPFHQGWRGNAAWGTL